MVRYIFDVFKEAYFALLQISVITRQVLENEVFILLSFEIFVFLFSLPVASFTFRIYHDVSMAPFEDAWTVP